MEKKHQFAMLASIVHIVNGDWPSLVHDLTEMDVIRPETNIRRFTMVVFISGCYLVLLCSSVFFALVADLALSR